MVPKATVQMIVPSQPMTIPATAKPLPARWFRSMLLFADHETIKPMIGMRIARMNPTIAPVCIGGATCFTYKGVTSLSLS